MNIRDLIKQIATDATSELFSVVGKVTAVDESKRTVDVEPLNGDAEIFNCRIQSAIESDKGVAIVPKKNSVVIVSFISKNHAFVTATNEIEKILIDIPLIDGVVDDIKIKDTKIVLNDGNNDGIVKVIELTDKLNAIERDINSLKSIFQSWIPTPQDGGSALKSASASWYAQTITETQKTDIENDKIKH